MLLWSVYCQNTVPSNQGGMTGSTIYNSHSIRFPQASTVCVCVCVCTHVRVCWIVLLI